MGAPVPRIGDNGLEECVVVWRMARCGGTVDPFVVSESQFVARSVRCAGWGVSLWWWVSDSMIVGVAWACVVLSFILRFEFSLRTVDCDANVNL